jgi:hypothetical protein
VFLPDLFGVYLASCAYHQTFDDWVAEHSNPSPPHRPAELIDGVTNATGPTPAVGHDAEVLAASGV